MKRGFTLMEVLVAVAILSVGLAGLGHALGAFLQTKERESKKGRALLEAVSLMEEQIAQPVPCVALKNVKVDTSLDSIVVSRQEIDFSLSYERIPGGAPLQWVTIHEASGYWNDLTLKRIVKCVETDSH